MGVQTLIAYLDTNVVIFLHAGNSDRLSHRAIEQIESADLRVSGMVILELEMLHEKGVLAYPASRILADLNHQIALSVCQLPMAAIMQSATQVKWTRDPGDRIIVANAIANNQAPLITSDRHIRTQYPNAIW